MDIILKFFGFIQGLGANVMMPIIISIIGICMGAGVGKSIRAGLTVGVGFIGLNLVLGIFGSYVAPAAEAMIANWGLSTSIMDVGWPAAAAIAMGSAVGTFIIPICLLVNIVMLITNTTQTVNIDIWNYWHFAFTGSLVYMLTGNIVYGIIAAIVNMVIIMVMGDVTAPLLEKANGMEGISLPHGFTTAYTPIAFAINWIIDKIPGVNKWDINLDKVQEKFGVVGEPIVIGSVLGVIIGILAGQTPAGVLGLGVQLGAVLVLIPKMAALFMEGLLPISDAATEFIQKRFTARGKMYIGLDSAIGIGNPTTLAVSLILIPVALILAVILPGNEVLPLVDLSVIPYMFVLIIPIVNGNGFRAIVVGIVNLAAGLLIATNLAPAITSSAIASGFEVAANTTISSICDGANPLTWIMVQFNKFGVIGVVLAVVLALALALWNRNRILKQAAEMHE
ncbi:MAG: PTS sugar transporter subunit IIC [Lachnospiraceae bacterium]|nr:PTS sugar transporter subunit IIC [Lachnospiraceae bacterium]MBR6526321.1 PTS sugar transporter subunit IIC [Lachnospiraceae bacterium]